MHLNLPLIPHPAAFLYELVQHDGIYSFFYTIIDTLPYIAGDAQIRTLTAMFSSSITGNGIQTALQRPKDISYGYLTGRSGKLISALCTADAHYQPGTL